MKSTSISIKKENLYSNTINKLISRYGGGIILKSFNLFLSENYEEAEMVLFSEFPENYFNKDLLAQYIAGHIKLKLGKYEDALVYFCQAMSKEVNFLPYIYDSKGLLYILQNKDFNMAVNNFKDACSFSQNNYNFHNHLAICYKIIYNLQKTKSRNLLDLSEKEEDSSYNSKNDNEKFNSSQSNNSSELDICSIAKEKKKEKDNKKLVKLTTLGNKIKTRYRDAFKEALNVNPNSYIGLLNLGTYYAEEGDVDQAGKYYKKAEIINKQTTGKKDWKIYLNLAFLAFKEKEYPLSIGYFEIVFKSFENIVNLKILNIYMICLYKNREWKKLEKIAKKILKSDKNNKRALVYLIISLEKNKKSEDLFLILKKVKSKLKIIKQKCINESSYKTKTSKEYEEQLQSPYSHYQKLKQIIKKKLKKVTEDIRIEQTGIPKEQNADTGFENFGRDNLRSFGFKHDFIEKLLILQNKNKDNVEVLFNLGYIYYKEEEFTKSEQFFNRVLIIDPEYKKNIINEYLGDIYMNHYNSAQKALTYYNRAHSVSINHSMSENNISANSLNNNMNDNELLLVKIGLCHEVLEDNESALRYYKLALKKNEDFVNPMFHMGCIYDKMNKSEEALKCLEIAYEKEKENVDYLQKYGDCLVKCSEENKISKGILILERGIEFFTGNIDIISSLAKGYEKQGRLKEAITLLEKAKNNEEFYNNKSKIFQLAFYYEKNKELTKAIEYFKKVLHLDKKNVDALLHIGYIYHSIKENVKAFKCFKQVLNLEKNNFLGFYGLGRLYQSLDNHYHEAINCFKSCLLINPESIKANLQLGIIYLKIKKYDESLNCLNKVKDLDPKNILGLVALGNVYLEMKKYVEAENYLEEALQLDKKNVAANAALGDVYFGMNEINEAIQKYLYVNKLNDNIPEIHLNLAHCFFINEKFESAISHYLKAIKLVKNTRHDYYYFLGNALMANYRSKDGIMAYQAAIKLKPTKLNYYFAIAKACYMEKLNQKGIKYLERLLDLEKDKSINKNILEAEKDYTISDALFLLYKLYITLPEPDYSKCLSIIKELIRNEPKNIQYLEILAGIQEKKENFFEAIKAYKQILIIEPNNLDAKKKLNLLDINQSEQQRKNQKSSSDSSSESNSKNNSNNQESQNSSSSENNNSKSKKESKNKSKNKSESESNFNSSNSNSKSNSKSDNKTNSKNSETSKKEKSENKSKIKENKSRNVNSESKIKSFNADSQSKESDYNKTNDPIIQKNNDNNNNNNKSYNSSEEEEKEN